MKLTNFSLALLLGLTLCVACGDDDTTGDAAVGDATTGTPDATTGTPDATVGTPDATVGTPDATVGTPDAAVVDLPPLCSDVAGNYMAAGQDANPPLCDMVPLDGTGTVTQDGTTVTVTINGNAAMCEVGADCICTGTVMAGPIPATFTWDINTQVLSATAFGTTCSFDTTEQ